MNLPLCVGLGRLIAGMNAFAELLRHLVMPDCSRRGRKWCLGASKTENTSKTNEESEMFHRASMSKCFPSVNSRKLATGRVRLIGGHSESIKQSRKMLESERWMRQPLFIR